MEPALDLSPLAALKGRYSRAVFGERRMLKGQQIDWVGAVARGKFSQLLQEEQITAVRVVGKVLKTFAELIDDDEQRPTCRRTANHIE
ncbi:hypothetical protein [Mycobacteroides abscessus]|uniref:hypothetical protein n=1 Tax=Mycobacteroides abscessus TaxID=36809 RepID=UPI0011C3B6C0|nr:hypothetical protein [Mycobacteroides abscessus]